MDKNYNSSSTSQLLELQTNNFIPLAIVSPTKLSKQISAVNILPDIETGVERVIEIEESTNLVCKQPLYERIFNNMSNQV